MPRTRTLLTRTARAVSVYDCVSVIPVLQRHYPEHALLFMAAAAKDSLDSLFAEDIHILFLAIRAATNSALEEVLTAEMICRAFGVSRREDHTQWRAEERVRCATRARVVARWPLATRVLDRSDSAYQALFHASLLITPDKTRKNPAHPGRLKYLQRLSRAVLTRYLFGGPQ